MKNLYSLLVFIFISLSSLIAQNTYVPDDNFELALIDLGLDVGLPDDFVPTNNINSLKTLDVTGWEIADLTGIEDFTALETLLCYDNDLTALNLNSNVNLKALSCGQNQIINLQVEGATALTTLLCDYNQLVFIDLSKNIALIMLHCNNNKLIGLNLHNGHNELLVTFSASYNGSLTCIEVDDATSANSGGLPYLNWSKPLLAAYSEDCEFPVTFIPDIKFEEALIARGFDSGEPDGHVLTYPISTTPSLLIQDCDITDLTGIEDFHDLEQLNCSGNQIVDLDLSKNTMLTDLDCSNNQLTGLIVRSGANYLLTSFNATGNPSLQCIEVDNEIKAVQGLAPYGSWLKDETAGYSSNCSLFNVQIYVPDDHFEQALINLGYDFGPLDDFVNASMVSRVSYLNVSSKYIQDLTGIEGFKELETLNCYNNFLQTLDLSQNNSLKYLSCFTNQLSELDLRGNSALISLNITNNLFEGSFDLSDCPELIGLDCQNNQLTELILTGNPKLQTLICRNNMITSLDLSGNDALKSLDCYNNLLTELDVSNMPFMTLLDCGYNNITELLITGSGLQNIKCINNELSSLDVSEISNLRQLDCRNNLLTDLDVSTNSELWFLDCSDNLLDELDLTGTTGLIDFVCNNNNLTDLVVSNCPLLGGLYCHHNDIGALNLSNNQDLLTLYCNSNQLVSLDLSLNIKLRYFNASDNPLVDFIEPGGGGKSGVALQTKSFGLTSTTANNNLKEINLSNTSLESINILNFESLDILNMAGTKLTSLDVSACVALRILNTAGTPLTCIQVNQDQLNSIPTGWVKDPTTIYSLDCQAVSIDDNNILAESIRLYPNPVKDILTVESDIPIINVEIYSIKGNRVKDIFSGFSAIPVNDLSEGIYIIKVESASGIVSKKFTVRH